MIPRRSNDDGHTSISNPRTDGRNPILFPGVLPVVPPDSDEFPSRAPRSNAATAASAAGVRALSAQLVAFYFRAPAKAFFRTRVDYLAYARTIHNAHTESIMKRAAAAVEQQGSGGGGGSTTTRIRSFLQQSWLWARGTTPGVLTSAIRHEGWAIVPQQILPPLMANVGVGAVLYTSYLHILGRLHEGSGRATKRVYPPPSPSSTFAAGFLAGGLQSVVAAPLDALQARYDHNDLMRGEGSRPRSMWSFGAEKLREIGLRGVFAGWSLSFTKDSLGSAIFFSVFEYVKAQGYYRFVTWYYGGLGQDTVDLLVMKRPANSSSSASTSSQYDGNDGSEKTAIIRPHYAIEPMFLLAAGISASFTQQLLLHPLTHFQVKHWDHLEELDAKAQQYRGDAAPAPATPGTEKPRPRFRMVRAYYHAYQETLAGCAAEAAAGGVSLSRWLLRGFWWNAIRQVPSTSAGLIIFELIRRKYGFGADEVRITKDGYDILLN